MNADDFNHVIEAQIERSTSVLINKAAEYATDDDRLHNFKVAAAMQGCTPSQALVGMMAKHTTSIFDMVGTGEGYTTAMWNEKITDHINYLLLLRAVVEEEHNNRSDKTGAPLEEFKFWGTSDLVLPSRKEAERFLDRLNDMVSNGRPVSIYDAYELLGVTSSFSDQKRGWYDLSTTHIERVPNGFALVFPMPQSLEEDIPVKPEERRKIFEKNDADKAVEDQTALNDIAAVLSNENDDDKIQSVFDIVEKVRVIEPRSPVSFERDDEFSENPSVLREQVLDDIADILNNTSSRNRTTAAIAAAVSQVRPLKCRNSTPTILTQVKGD